MKHTHCTHCNKVFCSDDLNLFKNGSAICSDCMVKLLQHPNKKSEKDAAKETLRQYVDTYGVAVVLEMLEDVCFEKSEYRAIGNRWYDLHRLIASAKCKVVKRH